MPQLLYGKEKDVFRTPGRFAFVEVILANGSIAQASAATDACHSGTASARCMRDEQLYSTVTDGFCTNSSFGNYLPLVK